LATDPDTDAAGLSSALGLMTDSFVQGGSQDLQRNSAWGIPPGLVVPAFVDAASYHLGLVTGLSGLPIASSEVGGGIENLFHAGSDALATKVSATLHHLDHNFHPTHYRVNDTRGAFGLSIDNAENIKAGFQFGDSILNSRAAVQSNTAANSATSGQVDLSLRRSDHWVLNPSSNQTTESFQQGADARDEWSIDGADFSVNPVNLPGISSGAKEGKESFNLNGSLGNTHTPDPGNGGASHRLSELLSPSPAGHHIIAAFDMIDAYENLLPYISVVPLGDDAVDLGARPVPAAMQTDDQMIAIGEAILRAEREAARTSPDGGASADTPANFRPDWSAPALSGALKPNAQTIALAAAFYKAIHKEPLTPADQGAGTHRRHGPTGHREDPIFIQPNGNMASKRTMN
jgi:hypothetical protein